MSWLSRIFQPLGLKSSSSLEGQPRPGPWLTMEGWLPSSWGKYWNYWQMGYDPLPVTQRTAIVQACISAYAQTIAMCPGAHWRPLANGGRQRVVTSALSRILRKPNEYQTISDFLLNLVSNLYSEGNAYALALRNDRFEISELHLMNSRQSTVSLSADGEIFYNLAGNEIVDKMLGSTQSRTVPARDVLHVKLETPGNNLKGITPLTSACLDTYMATSMQRQFIALMENSSRPSGVLSTDQAPPQEEVDRLRAKWMEHSQGLGAGGVPILTRGLKWTATAPTNKDSQIAELFQVTDQNIALAFRVPLQILGIGGTPFASTEALMQSWIASGLGFAIDHVEQAFDQTFGLLDQAEPREYCELDTGMLLRSAFADRVNALARSVQGGIHAPNEARAEFELPAVEDGDEPRVQQQVVPLSWPGFTPAPPAPPQPASDPAASDSADTADNAQEDAPPSARQWQDMITAAADDQKRQRLH